MAGFSDKPDFSTKSRFKDVPKTTVKLTNLLKVEPKKEQQNTTEIQREPDSPFTPEQLKQAWLEFAEQRKKFHAEHQMLSQPYEINNHLISIHLYNMVQESMLTNIKTDLTTFLRDKLKNQSININGILKEAEQRKVIYTNKEKFEYLVNKNPVLRELKDRLGLDTDY